MPCSRAACLDCRRGSHYLSYNDPMAQHPAISRLQKSKLRERLLISYLMHQKTKKPWRYQGSRYSAGAGR
jgi:hypothetical protein